MTHEELHEKINNHLQHCTCDGWGDKCYSEENKPWHIIRSIVELHRPYKAIDADEGLCCTSCSDWNGQPLVPYPCVTIQTIEKELA